MRRFIAPSSTAATEWNWRAASAALERESDLQRDDDAFAVFAHLLAFDQSRKASSARFPLRQANMYAEQLLLPAYAWNECKWMKPTACARFEI